MALRCHAAGHKPPDLDGPVVLRRRPPTVGPSLSPTKLDLDLEDCGDRTAGQRRPLLSGFYRQPTYGYPKVGNCLGTDRHIWNLKVNAWIEDTNLDRFGLPYGLFHCRSRWGGALHCSLRQSTSRHLSAHAACRSPHDTGHGGPVSLVLLSAGRGSLVPLGQARRSPSSKVGSDGWGQLSFGPNRLITC